MLADYYQFLKKYISFKTISTQEGYEDEMRDVVQWLKHEFELHGLQSKIVEGYGNPILLSYYQANRNAPTCLLYGHYDVQAASKDEGWKHDPFSLYIGKDKILGRGVADNKGQTLIHLHTIFELIKENALGYNLIVLLEGDEETGSSKLKDFLDKYKDSLQADFALISDGEIVGERPCVDCGFRGGFNARLTVKTAQTDLHSGLYGGVVPNAIHEMNKLLSKLFDSGNHVTVPYFYYEVDDITGDERLINIEKEKYFDMEAFKKNTGVKAIVKEKEFSFYSQVGLRPTIQVTGIEAGYIGNGFKNAIPPQATAHLNFRLVESQHPEKIAKAVEGWIRSTLPAYVDFEFEAQDFHAPIKLDISNNLIQRTKDILKEVYGDYALHNYSGGGLPIVKLFKDVLGLTNVLVPLANDDCNMHGVNENFDITLIQKGMEFSRRFFKN